MKRKLSKYSISTENRTSFYFVKRKSEPKRKKKSCVSARYRYIRSAGNHTHPTRLRVPPSLQGKARESTSLRVKRSNPEDWCTNHYTIRSDLYCGVDVPDETGKMSRSDKRGATCLRLPQSLCSFAMTCQNSLRDCRDPQGVLQRRDYLPLPGKARRNRESKSGVVAFYFFEKRRRAVESTVS